MDRADDDRAFEAILVSAQAPRVEGRLAGLPAVLDEVRGNFNANIDGGWIVRLELDLPRWKRAAVAVQDVKSVTREVLAAATVRA